MVVDTLQVVGFLLGIISWVGMIGTCASPEWRRTDLGLAVIGNSLEYEGLWMKCEAYSPGETKCRYFNEFYLQMTSNSGVLHVCRALMISSISLGFIAINVTVFGMKCVIVGSSNPRAKAIIALIGGCFFGISGILTGAAVSYFAQDIVQEFYNPADSRRIKYFLRFDYGYALYIGWASLVVGMICCVLIVSLSLFILRQKPGSSVLRHNKATSLHCQHVPLHSMHRRPGGQHRQVKINSQKMHHQQQLPYNHQSLSNGSTLQSQHIAPTSEKSLPL